jgi:monoamine oxidase
MSDDTATVDSVLPTSAVETLPRSRVVVIGAGVSGLAAARALCRGTFDVASGRRSASRSSTSTAVATASDTDVSVLILEARDRIGGRCYTTKLANGIPIDLGASFIHGCDTSNPVYNLALKRKIKVDKRGGGYSLGKRRLVSF